MGCCLPKKWLEVNQFQKYCSGHWDEVGGLSVGCPGCAKVEILLIKLLPDVTYGEMLSMAGR